jgi:hypothetical protein
METKLRESWERGYGESPSRPTPLESDAASVSTTTATTTAVAALAAARGGVDIRFAVLVASSQRRWG